MEKVLVYGTLKKGGALHSAINKSKFIGEKTISGFEMYNMGWYPAIIRTDDETSRIHVEEYEVDDVTSKRLDRVEGYPSLYQKTLVDGAFIYYMENTERVSGKAKVKNNNWNVNGDN